MKTLSVVKGIILMLQKRLNYSLIPAVNWYNGGNKVNKMQNYLYEFFIIDTVSSCERL